MKNKSAQSLGRLGGKAKTSAKASAARANGAKGGRPARNTVYLVRARFGLRKLDYGFGAVRDQHVPHAGQVGPDGEPISASTAKVMRSKLPVGWGTGSTFTLQIAGVRVSPGDVEVLASYSYAEPDFGVVVIDGEPLKWTTWAPCDNGYQTADGRRFRGVLDYLAARAGISG